MPPRKKPVKITIKTPKANPKEANKGSLRKSVDFDDLTDDYVPVIQIPSVKEPVVHLILNDTDHTTNSTMLFLGWNDLFLKFKDEDYLGTIPHSDPMVRKWMTECSLLVKNLDCILLL
jgi:hypothetical protein